MRTVELTQMGPHALTKPISVRLYWEVEDGAGYFVAENNELHILATGETEEEALEGVEIYFVHDIEAYTGDVLLCKSARDHYELLRQYLPGE